MQDELLNLGLGIVVGGLIMSAGWGAFWLVIGVVGLSRQTCGWPVLLNSLTVLVVPLLLVWGLLWARGGPVSLGSAFGIGLSVVPLLLLGFALRQAPDGQRAGRHMLAGVRHLIDDLLGKHHGCAGCNHEQEHENEQGGLG